LQVVLVPLQWSVASQAPPWDVPVQVVVLGSKASAGHAPELPVQVSATSHWPLSGRQTTVDGWYSSRQVLAVPLQWSRASHAPPCEVPVQTVVVGAKASSGHAPDVPVQLSATSHCPAESRQTVVEGWYSSMHAFAVPLQWSVASQAPPCDTPVHVVVGGAKTSAGQAPVAPVQLSATSHWPADSRHTVVAGWYSSRQALAVPLQWSVASQAPPSEAPVHAVVLGSKASAGHAPEVPVQVSATSHCPASARHTKPEGRYSSTQALLVPAQWSVASQAPPSEVPAHVVVLGSKASAGQAPELPVQVSATSHWPVSGRQTTVDGWYSSRQVLAVPLQWSTPSHTPPSELPVQSVAGGANPSAGHAADVPVQLSATSHCPADSRQTVVGGEKTSGGQAPAAPVQVSATSQGPAAPRQTVAADWYPSTQVSPVPLQWSAASQAPPCEAPVHVVVLGSKTSAGHAPELPVHVSATSHWPVSGRQTVVEGWYWSTQVLLVPLQWSGASHTPPWELPTHAVVAGAKPSAGQAVLEPVQVSAASHTPVAARHTTPALPAGCSQTPLPAVGVPPHWSLLQTLPSSVHGVPPGRVTFAGQVALVPVQTSCGSHTSLEARQTVPAGARVSGGQIALLPLHVSAVSHAPVDARHTPPALPGVCVQIFPPPPRFSHRSTVQALLSLQSLSLLHWVGRWTQSEGSEFGLLEG